MTLGRSRTVALLAALPTALALAYFVHHDLVHSYPFKMGYRPLAQALADSALWVAVAIVLAAIAGVLLLRDDLLSTSPLVAYASGLVVAILTLFWISSAVVAGAEDVEVGGDFGLAEVQSGFFELAASKTVLVLMLAAGSAAALLLTRKRWWRAS